MLTGFGQLSAAVVVLGVRQTSLPSAGAAPQGELAEPVAPPLPLPCIAGPP